MSLLAVVILAPSLSSSVPERCRALVGKCMIASGWLYLLPINNSPGVLSCMLLSQHWAGVASSRTKKLRWAEDQAGSPLGIIPEFVQPGWFHKGSLATQREHLRQLYRQTEKNE